jgi:DivIVA domain-containing protein
MTSGQNGNGQEPRGLTPADLQNVRFTRASMMRPGYADAEVDRVMSRVAEELGRLYSEKAALRDEVRSLRAQVESLAEGVAAAPEPPSEQAVRILASAQLTADNYVAEAEEFSRQVTSEARSEYEELTRQARENAGAIIQAAQEAAAKLADGAPLQSDGGGGRTVEELEEQVAYLKAFGQACRVQLRSYLEALISDVESEWGRADPAAVQAGTPRPPAQRSASDDGSGAPTTFIGNTVAETPPDEGVEVVHSAARFEPGP